MNILELWREKNLAGSIRFDPDTRIVSESEAGDWGVVYYSPIRESYKSEIKERPTTSFDLALMDRMHLFDYRGLRVAANPNSLFEGHLVIYPRTKSAELEGDHFADITALAAEHADFTFIHNGDRSAASILDWAHFQAYATRFPLADEPINVLIKERGISLAEVSSDYPAYALRLEVESPETRSGMLRGIYETLSSQDNPRGERIPVNFIWMGGIVWIIPRAKDQSERAARYFGGLEMGGIFCLPHRSDSEEYASELLRDEVRRATLRTDDESATREWFLQKIKQVIRNA